MVELSSDEPTRSSRRTRGALSSVYFCVLPSPNRVGLRRRSLASRSLNKRSTRLYTATTQLCQLAAVLKNLRESSEFFGTILGHLPFVRAGLNTQMGLRSRPESCTDTSSQVPISGVVILSWRNLQSVREHTKQLYLVGGHFYFGTRGCARNSKLRP